MILCRKFLTLFGLLIVACGCSRGVSGTFADDDRVTAYEFHSDGRATISVLGTIVAAEYTTDGDRVLVTSAQGTVVLTQRNGRLYGPMGLELRRQNDKIEEEQ